MLGFRKEGRNGGLLPLRRVARYSLNQAEAAIRARAQYAYLGDRLGVCRVLGRFKMYVDPQDVGHSSHLILEGAWELWVTRFLISRLREGMIAVDVGANLGYFTLLMAELVGAKGAVHAFEPNCMVADRLDKSILVNGFGHVVTLHRVAVGSQNDTAVKLVVPDSLPSGAWLVPVDAVEEGLTVPVRRLDDYPDLARANVIKIDAEGFEYEAWKGMEACISNGHPMLILLEFANGRYAHSAAFIDEILAAGFSLAVIERDGSPRSVGRAEVLSWPADRDVMLALTRG